MSLQKSGLLSWDLIKGYGWYCTGPGQDNAYFCFQGMLYHQQNCFAIFWDVVRIFFTKIRKELHASWHILFFAFRKPMAMCHFSHHYADKMLLFPPFFSVFSRRFLHNIYAENVYTLKGSGKKISIYKNWFWRAFHQKSPLLKINITIRQSSVTNDCIYHVGVPKLP